MDSDKVLNTDTSRLNFMYNQILMPRVYLANWLRVSEFIDAMNSLLDKGIAVTNDIVLDTCEGILSNDNINNKEFKIHYQYRNLRRGVKQLKQYIEAEAQTQVDTTMLNFLCGKISMPKECIDAWMRVPEFANAVNSLVNSQLDVTNASVLTICKGIEDRSFSDKDFQKKHYLQTLKRGLNHLKRATESASASESERTSS